MLLRGALVASPALVLPLLLSALFLSLLPPVHAACAADYASCGGGVPSPVGNLRCCSDDFFCYTHGPYFSQCRPRSEEHSDAAVKASARWYVLRSVEGRRAFLTPRQASRMEAAPMRDVDKVWRVPQVADVLRAMLPSLSSAQRRALVSEVSRWAMVCDATVLRGELAVSPCLPTHAMQLARELSHLSVVAAVYTPSSTSSL